MKRSTKLRLIGGTIIIFNLFVIGLYNVKGMPVLLGTFGVAIIFEAFIKTRKGAQ